MTNSDLRREPEGDEEGERGEGEGWPALSERRPSSLGACYYNHNFNYNYNLYYIWLLPPRRWPTDSNDVTV